MGGNGTGLDHEWRRSSVSGLRQKAMQRGRAGKAGDFSFVQISDSHMGFNKPANPDVVATLQAAVDKINGLPNRPEFLLHTGDISHLSRPEQFDTVDQVLKGASAKDIFFVPGEHDVLDDNGKSYLERYGKNAQGAGWYSFDHKGVHFIGLVNVLNLKAGGLGSLGGEQLEWMEKDVKHLKHSTPIVVFAHIPLWSVYPEWGWGTEDSAQALGYLKKFGSVTVLNGHIHQIMQKVEGNVTFHTAMSTAFPQPQPGKADSPGPMKVPAEQLRSLLGITDVNYRSAPALSGSSRFNAWDRSQNIIKRKSISGQKSSIEGKRERQKMTKRNVWIASLASIGDDCDSCCHLHRITQRQGGCECISPPTVKIDNFSFAPQTLTVPVGATVTWTNRDDIPHTAVSTDGVFKSKVMDTDEKFSYTFTKPGTYPYYCTIHPKMTGKVIVQ